MVEIIFPLIIIVALIGLAVIMYNISKENYKRLAAELEEEQAKIVEEKIIPVEVKIKPVEVKIEPAVEPQVEVKQETVAKPAVAPKPSKKHNRKKKTTN
jgi:hypothetical protein